MINKIKISEKKINKIIKNKILFLNLKSFIILKIFGNNFKKFIQNIVTCNIDLIKYNKFKICYQSNYNGKIISIMLFFYDKKKLFCIINKNIYKKSINFFKKYDIRNEIKIINKIKYKILGILGNFSYYFIKNILGYFNKKYENVSYLNKIYILNLSKKNNMYILLSNKKNIDNFIKNNINYIYKKYFLNDNLWIYLNCINGIPYINKKNSNIFYPEEIGSNKLKSISTNKKCYLGQEIILKIKILKLNKKSLYILKGKLEKIPKIGSYIINKENKIKVGKILYYIVFKNNIFVQAVLNNKKTENIKINDYKSNIYIYKKF